MAKMTTSAEYHQGDTAAAKERICKEEESSFMQGNLQREFENEEPTLDKSLPTGSDTVTQSVDVPACMSIRDEGRQSPVPSVASMKSDHSMVHPFSFSEDYTKCLVQTERPDSPSSVSSEEQDVSALSFGNRLSSDHDGGRQSPVPSVLSMKSDKSMSPPPTFSEDCTRTSGREKVVLCSACPWAACKSCLTCTASYCESHVRQHYTAPALQRHKLVEATADLEQRLCQQHHRRLELFCKTDQTLVCALCVIKEHGGHEIMELEENESLQPYKSQMQSQKDFLCPGPITFTSVNSDSVSLSWGPPEGQTETYKFRVTWKCEGDKDTVEVSDVRFTVEELIPGEKYEFTVATLMADGSQSPCVFATTKTEIPKPDNVDVTTDLTSLTVTWSKPAGVDEVKYLLSLHSEGECLKTLTLKSHKRHFPGLLMGNEYSISISTILKNGGQSSPVSKTTRTKVPGPQKLSIDAVTATSANLSWSLSHVMDENPHSFLISYQSKGTEPQTISTDSCSTVITGLTPGTEYTVSVITKVKHGGQSQPSTKTISTDAPVPERLTVDLLTETSEHTWSAALSWTLPHSMGQPPLSFKISYHSEGTEPEIKHMGSCSTVITGLLPDTKYTASVCTVSQEGNESGNASITIYTGEMRLVLLGKTGVGKSSTGNTILGDNEGFEIGNSSTSETDKCTAKSRTTRGRLIKVIDTPGFVDTDLSDELLYPEIANCTVECSPGPHAFIVVLRVGTYTAHEQEIIMNIKELFGEEALKYVVILFTHGDQLIGGQRIEDFVKQGSGRQSRGTSVIGKTALRELVDACGGRCHVIDNRYWNQEHEYRSNRVQVEKLLDTIDEMLRKQGGHYTNDFLMLIQKAIQKATDKKQSQENPLSREEIKKEAIKEVKQTLKNQAAGLTAGLLFGALCGPFTVVASAVGLFTGLLVAVGGKIKKETKQKTEEQRPLLQEDDGSTTNQKTETTGTSLAAAAAGAGTAGTGIAAGVLVGLKAVAAATAGGLGAAAGCGIAAGAMAGLSVVAGAVKGGIEGADKTSAEKCKNAGEAVKGAVEQTFNVNFDIIKKAYTLPSEKINKCKQ